MAHSLPRDVYNKSQTGSIAVGVTDGRVYIDY